MKVANQNDEFQNEFAALSRGAIGTFIFGVFGATGIAWLAGTVAVANPGEPDFWPAIRAALASVRLPSGVDASAVSISLSAIVLTLVLAVSISEPRELEAPAGVVVRSAWLARLAGALSLAVCVGQVWLCGASVVTAIDERVNAGPMWPPAR